MQTLISCKIQDLAPFSTIDSDDQSSFAVATSNTVSDEDPIGAPEQSNNVSLVLYDHLHKTIAVNQRSRLVNSQRHFLRTTLQQTF